MTALDILIRRGALADLPTCVALWHEAEVEGEADPPPPPDPVPAPFRWELEAGTHCVAEHDGAVVGYGATFARGDWTWLSSLFVRGALRSGGVGQRLLEQLLPREGRCCTVSSTDFRAQALYIRHGLRPLWGHYHLAATSAQLRPSAPSDVTITPAASDDGELLAWDAEIGGRARPQDHAFWARELGGLPLWITRGGARIGYGYVQQRNPFLLWEPAAWTLGPLGARTPADARDCVLAAVAWARGQAATLRIALPGPHAALAPLLELGFRIVYVEQFLCSAPPGFADPERYLFSGSELF
jgi:GNAT superfamily N-acetyltransferase